MKTRVRRLTFSAVMLALATVLAAVCAFIPFLNLPFGGGFTIASMLPIVLVSYMYGIRNGLFTGFCYSVIQILMDLFMGRSGVILALFTPSSESYQGLFAAFAILLLEYFGAYTVIGLGGLFRNRLGKTGALCLGTIVALGMRYILHVLSGAIFYGMWAEWFFTQEGFYAFGQKIVDALDAGTLSVVYSVFYNGLYMIPEIIITSFAAVIVSRLPQVRKY